MGKHSYGQERWSNGTTSTDFGFNAQRNEASFGLMDYNARYYSPGLGRFVWPDSIVPNPNKLQDFNRYSYSCNNGKVLSNLMVQEISISTK